MSAVSPSGSAIADAPRGLQPLARGASPRARKEGTPAVGGGLARGDEPDGDSERRMAPHQRCAVGPVALKARPEESVDGAVAGQLRLFPG
jgi:hypothetical protein